MTESKVSTEYDGKPRILFRCECKQCGKEFWRPAHRLDEAKCCSKECYKLFREKTGKRVDVICTYCGKTFRRFRHHLAKVVSGRYFCSRDCQKEGTKKKRDPCQNCGRQLIGKARKYCSDKCQSDFQYKRKIEEWKRGELAGMYASESLSSWLRKYLIEKYANKCSICGWCQVNSITGKVPIQVDHIDGDYTNNKEENLRLLCPNCHSLTPTFGALNKGRGRVKRRMKLQQAKVAA